MTRATSASSESAAATYVYGVVPAVAGGGDLLDGVEGVQPGAGVELLAQGGIAVLLSSVSLEDFGEEAIEERMQDPRWLADKARAHGRVLERALAAGAVVPFRFGAIFRSREDLSALLAEREDDLRAELERVAGKVELGVKAFAPPGLAERVRAEATEVRRLTEELTEQPAGRRYLLQKQLEQLVARETAALRARIADESHVALTDVSAAAAVNAPQDPEVGGFEGQMLLNGAYLVEAAAQREFLGAVDSLRASFEAYGIRFDVTGPWPPYNFVSAEVA